MQLANEPESIQPAPVESIEPSIAEAPDGADEARAEGVEAEIPLDEEPEAATIGGPAASPSLLRAAYVLIFLLAVLVSYTVWPQAGGQGHLDLMPWYLKLFPPLAFSYAVVRASAAAATEESSWNRRTIGWVSLALLLASLIGGLTYYYHLQESLEQVDSDDGVMTSVQARDDRTHA